MPRQPSGRNEGGRERTRRYRNRLRSSGTPEADAVDYAVAASVAALAEVLRLQSSEARAAVLERREELRLWLEMGVLQDAEVESARAELAVPVDEAAAKPEAMAPADLLKRILLGAVALLVDRECDPAQARRKLHHRVGRGGDHGEVESLVQKSGVSLTARSRRSRGHA